MSDEVESKVSDILRIKNTTVELGLGLLGTNPSNPNLACSDDQRLNASWYYNWKPRPSKCPEGAAFTAEFVPMIWNGAHIDKATGEIAQSTRDQANKVGYLLGFNEPDGSGQADMTVQEAIAAWPALEQKEGDTYLLGSPAPKKNGSVSKNFKVDKELINHDWSDDSLVHPEFKPSNKWLPKFMANAAKLGLRVDFMALHYYYYCEGNKSNQRYNTAKTQRDLKKWLNQMAELYQRPIWITEFSCLSSSLDANVAFLKDSMEVIEKYNLDPKNKNTQVERVAWFANRKSKFGRYYAHTHLVDFLWSEKVATLTPVGEEYKKHGKLANSENR